MKNYLTGLLFVFLFSINLQGQTEQVANLRFFTDGVVSCENNPAICFQLQVQAESGEMFEFFGMNVRMFFDGNVFTFNNIETTLANIPFPGAYTYSPATVNPPVVNDYGMVDPQYLQFNITGITSTFVTQDISSADWTTVAEICFVINGDIQTIMEVCEPLVWDLQQDGSGGFQGGNDGVVLLGLDPANLPVPLDEEVTQYNWDYTGNTSGQPSANPLCTDVPCAPLAVEMSQFNVSRSGQRQAKLYWVTESETNNDYFLVQRSADGVVFEDIGKVKGHGTTSKRHFYEMYDNDPYRGINYYRLIQYDFDGTNAKSPIRSVTFEDLGNTGGQSLSVIAQPNPFVNSLRVDYEGEGASLLTVYDADGTLIKTYELEGRVRQEVDLEEYPAGIYVIKVINGEKEQTLKVMKAD